MEDNRKTSCCLEKWHVNDNESSVYLNYNQVFIFLIWTVHLDNQIVDEEKCLFIKVFLYLIPFNNL